jgi:hypothetical protein
MQTDFTLHPTITADTIDNTVTISQPKCTSDKLSDIVGQWVNKQGRHWPTELTTEILIEDLSMVHLPHWVLDGNGSANWSASIGEDYKVTKVCDTCKGEGRAHLVFEFDEKPQCNTCNGKGVVEKTEVRWGSQSGVVHTRLNGLVRQNIFPDTIQLRLKKQDLSTSETNLDKVQADKITVLKPEQANKAAGTKKAEEALRDDLESIAYDTASRMGQVRDLQIAYVQSEGLNSRIWLYPLYLGLYSYEEEELEVQIDGVTGEVHAQIPKSVKNKRMKDMLIIGGIAVIIIIIIILVLSNNS